VLNLQLKVKLVGGILPKWVDMGDAGLDLYSAVDVTLPGGDVNVAVPLGLTTTFSSMYVAMVKDRSSMAVKGIFTSAGIIDSSYRGEWKILLRSTKLYNIKRGDKIAQVLFLPVFHLQVKEVDSLSESNRGIGGFGSTGK